MNRNIGQKFIYRNKFRSERDDHEHEKINFLRRHAEQLQKERDDHKREIEEKEKLIEQILEEYHENLQERRRASAPVASLRQERHRDTGATPAKKVRQAWERLHLHACHPHVVWNVLH